MFTTKTYTIYILTTMKLNAAATFHEKVNEPDNGFQVTGHSRGIINDPLMILINTHEVASSEARQCTGIRL